MGMTNELEDELDSALIRAVDMSDVEQVNYLLENYRKNVRRYQRPPNINNCFMTSVLNGDLDIVKLLLRKYQADVNCHRADSANSRAIHIVAKNGNVEIAKEIVNRGGSVNISDSDGQYPLQLAVENNHIEMVKFLIAQGAAINRYSSLKDHPLHTAIMKNNWDMFDILVRKGAVLNKKNKRGETCIHYAIRCQQFTLLEKLCERGADVNIGYPLRFAILQNSFQMAATLISFGARGNIVNANGETILNDLPIIYVKDVSRNSELHQYVYKHILEGSKSMINARDAHHYTPLHHAAMVGNQDICKIYLKYGANINATTLDGNVTPLQCSVGPGGSAELALYLIDHGAKTNIRPHKSITMFNRRLQGGENLLNQLVLSASVAYFDPYQVELLNRLIEMGSQINYIDDHNCTPLERYILLSNASFWAGLRQTTLRSKEVIAIFVAAGATLGQTKKTSSHTSRLSERHVSPLCRVTWYGDFDTSRFLIDSGVDITKEKWIHFQGKTPEVESYLEEIRSHSKAPAQLIFMCRNLIRKWISQANGDTDIRPNIQTLPLPQFLIQYLMLEKEIELYMNGEKLLRLNLS